MQIAIDRNTKGLNKLIREKQEALRYAYRTLGHRPDIIANALKRVNEDPQEALADMYLENMLLSAYTERLHLTTEVRQEIRALFDLRNGKIPFILLKEGETL